MVQQGVRVEWDIGFNEEGLPCLFWRIEAMNLSVVMKLTPDVVKQLARELERIILLDWMRLTYDKKIAVCEAETILRGVIK